MSRDSEERAARRRRDERDLINAGARELRRLGALDQYADRPQWAYAAFAMAAVFDTVAVSQRSMPAVLLSDALRACDFLLNPLPGDKHDPPRAELTGS